MNNSFISMVDTKGHSVVPRTSHSITGSLCFVRFVGYVYGVYFAVSRRVLCSLYKGSRSTRIQIPTCNNVLFIEPSSIQRMEFGFHSHCLVSVVQLSSSADATGDYVRQHVGRHGASTVYRGLRTTTRQ